MKVPELLDRILQAYFEALAFLDQVGEEDLDLRGRHSSGEVISAETFFRRMASHRVEHSTDIQDVCSR